MDEITEHSRVRATRSAEPATGRIPLSVRRHTPPICTLLAILLLTGCCTGKHCVPTNKWHTDPVAQVSVTPSPDGRALTTLFGGLEVRGTNAPNSSITLSRALRLIPLDAAARDARLDLRGFVSLSREARAQCRIEWNGKVVHLSQLPCEAMFGATNQNWSCHVFIPRKEFRGSKPNSLAIHLPLTTGIEPSLDYLTLDSVDLNWQTNREPGRP